VPANDVAVSARTDGDTPLDRALTTTVAPSAAKRCAIPRPIPLLLPVTNAVFPANADPIALLSSHDEIGLPASSYT